ncbi:MAG: ABC transporter permease [Dehalococcoidia bacterium]
MFVRFVLSKVASTIVVLFLVSLAVFGMIRALPGDPVTLALGQGFSYNEESAERARDRLGLDEPIVVQYVKWLGRVAEGDLGHSLRGQGEVLPAVLDRLPITAQLGAAGLLVSVLIAVPAGTIAAAKRGTNLDRFVSLFAMGGVAMPSFWLAILLILLFGVRFDLFPLYGFVSVWDDPVEFVKHVTLPAIALGVTLAGPLIRQVRSSVLDVLHEDYIRTAHAKGLSGRVVLVRHALRNALLPVLTLLGLQTAHVLGGAVVIEQVFSIPGVGRLAVQGILDQDFMVVQGVVLVSAVVVVLTNMFVDILYGYVDPRIRA